MTESLQTKFLEMPQFPVDYEWVLELKYVRKERSVALSGDKILNS